MDEEFQRFVSGICIKCFRVLLAPRYRKNADCLHLKLVSRGHSTPNEDTDTQEGRIDIRQDLCIICRCCKLDGSCQLFDNVQFLTCLRDVELNFEYKNGIEGEESSDGDEFSVYRLFDAIKSGLIFEACGKTCIHKGFNFCILAIHLINNVALNERFKRTFVKNLLKISLKGGTELPKEWDAYISKLSSDDLFTSKNGLNGYEKDMNGEVGPEMTDKTSASPTDETDNTEAPQTTSQLVDYRLRQEALDALLEAALAFKKETRGFYSYMESVCKDRLLFEQLIRIKVNLVVEGSQAFRIARFSLSRDTITFTGVYNKYARGLSQTLWILDNKVVTSISIEECIGAPLNQSCGSREYKFMASGREDSDVRTFGNGRIFCIEMYNCTRDIFEILHKTSRMIYNANNDRLEQQMLFVSSLAGCNDVQHADARLLKDYFGPFPADPASKTSNSPTSDSVLRNNPTPSTEFRNLKISFNNRLERQRVQNDAEGKLKSYNCLVFSADPLDINVLKRNIKYPIDIKQRNPIRISHRRSQDVRNRKIYSISIDPLHPRLFILSISTQAGTYVKEFVTGDLGRTRPSLKSILGSSDLYVLHLDVLDIQT